MDRVEIGALSIRLLPQIFGWRQNGYSQQMMPATKSRVMTTGDAFCLGKGPVSLLINETCSPPSAACDGWDGGDKKWRMRDLRVAASNVIPSYVSAAPSLAW